MRLAIIGTREKDFILQTFLNHNDNKVEIAAFVDVNPRKSVVMDYYCSLPLITFEILKEKFECGEIDGCFIATYWTLATERITLRLIEYGINRIFIPYPGVIEKQIDFFKEFEDIRFNPKYVYTFNPDKPFIYRLVCHIVDHCNLGCKSCSNFSPLEQHKTFRSIKEFERDVSKITELFDNVMCICLGGGEPLLAPELCMKFAEIVRIKFPYSEIRLFTNGLLIPKTDDKLFNRLTELNVKTTITLYEPTKLIYDDILEKLNRINANYMVFSNRVTFTSQLTAYPFEDVNWNEKNCSEMNSHYLSHGKLFQCPESDLIKNFDSYFGTNIYRENGFDIFSKIESWDLIKKLNKAGYLCAYCAKKESKKRKWSNERDYKQEDWLIEHKFQRHSKSNKKIISEQKSQIVLLEQKNEELYQQIEDLRCNLDNTKKVTDDVINQIKTIENSMIWRISFPLRWLFDRIKFRD